MILKKSECYDKGKSPLSSSSTLSDYGYILIFIILFCKNLKDMNGSFEQYDCAWKGCRLFFIHEV